MFEESLFDQSAEPQREGDFLYHYEIKPWGSLAWVPKILAVSVVLNILLVAGIGQASVLTAKGCDSPLVSRVCQVLDAMQIGTALFGTEREYADAAYEKTELADADITFVDVSGAEPKFEYPSGYFQVANPEQMSMGNDLLSGSSAFSIPNYTPPPPSTNLMNVTPQLPKLNPNPVAGDLPNGFNDPGSIGINPIGPTKGRGGKSPGGKGNSATASTNTNSNNGNAASNSNTNSNTQTAKADEGFVDKFGIYINKRPMREQTKATLEEIAANKVFLDRPFKVVISGSLGLGKDGKTVVLKNPKSLPVDKNVPNDPAMMKLVQEWIIAVGDAGWFGYLDKIGVKNIVITVEQNDTDLIASVRADQPSEEAARTAQSGLNAILGLAVPAAKEEERKFLEKASVMADGKAFVLNFNIPKAEAQDMIQKKLAEPTQTPTPTSATPGNTTSQTASK